MQSNTTNTLAILQGEQRSNRYRYRHTVAAAAREIGIPATWIWSWLLAKRLRSVTSLRCVWVRLEDVQKLFADHDAVRAAFFATGEFLTSPQAIQAVVERWPDAGVRPYIKFQPPCKVVPIRAPKAANPVLCEEKKSREAA
jgi:hypothetical protein